MKHNKLHDVLLAAPGYLIYTVFMIIPLGLCLFYSFTNWDGISKNYKIIGLSNFIHIFRVSFTLSCLIKPSGSFINTQRMI